MFSFQFSFFYFKGVLFTFIPVLKAQVIIFGIHSTWIFSQLLDARYYTGLWKQAKVKMMDPFPLLLSSQSSPYGNEIGRDGQQNMLEAMTEVQAAVGGCGEST